MTRFSWAGSRSGLLPLLLLGLAVLLLWVPAYHRLATGLWTHPDHAYAPWLTVVAWGLLLFRLRELSWRSEAEHHPAGWALLLLGAVTYVLGRTQSIELVELPACMVMLVGSLTLAGGWQAVRQMRFPILFWLFTLPYPAWLIDLLTVPLRMGLSYGADALLHALGYPIARSGMVIALGPYRLLVQDACSGLHSLIFLSALGLLYLHLTGPRKAWHFWSLLAALLPIALLANFLRVLVLLLTTYYLGDGVGQGLWHDTAGLMLFVTGFAALYGLDSGLGVVASSAPRVAACPKRRDVDAMTAQAHALPSQRALGMTVFWSFTALAALTLTPHHRLADASPMPELEQLVPKRMGEWHHDAEADSRYVSVEVNASAQGTYQQLLARTYANSEGQRIMLVIAYGSQQLGSAFQAHRPEACYKAQGFEIMQAENGQLKLDGAAMPVRQLLAHQNARIEAITYWMTIANAATLPGIPRKLEQLRHGLRGQIPDGALVRISSIGPDSAQAYALHRSFAATLLQAVPGRLGL